MTNFHDYDRQLKMWILPELEKLAELVEDKKVLERRSTPLLAICGHLTCCLDDQGIEDNQSEVINTLHDIWRDWPKFSGYDAYPMPAPKAATDPSHKPTWPIGLLVTYKAAKSAGYPLAQAAYLAAATWTTVPTQKQNAYWTGEYGELRKELLHYLIARIKADLNSDETPS